MFSNKKVFPGCNPMNVSLLFLAWRKVCALLLGAACLAGVHADAAELSGRTALIIGIGKYERPEVPSLGGVIEDMKSAKTIARAMGISDQNIRLLRDGEATKQGILDALKLLGESTADGARTLLYYSGHGTRWKDAAAGGCVEGLLSYDSLVITNAEIAEATRRLSAKADKFVSLIDACHSRVSKFLCKRS